MTKEILGFELPVSEGLSHLDFPELAGLDPSYDGDHSLRILTFSPYGDDARAREHFTLAVGSVFVPVVDLKIYGATGQVGMPFVLAGILHKGLVRARDTYVEPARSESFLHPIRTARNLANHGRNMKLLASLESEPALHYYERLLKENMSVTLDRVPEAGELVDRHLRNAQNYGDLGLSFAVDWEKVSERLMDIYKKHLGIEAPVQDCSSHSGGYQKG